MERQKTRWRLGGQKEEKRTVKIKKDEGKRMKQS